MAFKQNVAMSLNDLPRDPHQMLLHELHRENREDALKVDLIGGRPVDQRVGASDQYLVLDSAERNKVLSNIEKGIFVFDIKDSTGTAEEIIGVHNELHTISEIEFQSFPMPDISINFVANERNNIPTDSPCIPTMAPPCLTFITTDKLFYNNLLFPQFPAIIPIPDPTPMDPNNTVPLPSNLFQTSNNRFEIQISETSLQSYSDKCGFRHNFAFDLINLNGQVYANPVSPVFVFTDPINSINTFNLTFFDAYRCVPLKFKEDVLCNSRIGVQRNTVTNEPPRYYLTLYVTTQFPPFKVGDKGYLSPNDLTNNCRKDQCKSLINVPCFESKIFRYLTGCGLNAVNPNEYPLVARSTVKVTKEDPISMNVHDIYNNNTGYRYWVTTSNPLLEYPIVTTPLMCRATPMDPLVNTNSIEITINPTFIAQYDFADIDPTREIIILIPNQPANDADPCQIITCVCKGQILFKYYQDFNQKVKINTCQVSIYLEEERLQAAVADPNPIPIMDLPLYSGIYMIKDVRNDIHVPPYTGGGNPLYSAIKLTSAKPLLGTNTLPGTEQARSADAVRRTELLPNIDEVCLCIPQNQLRIPVRVRRILRRITQLGGL